MELEEEQFRKLCGYYRFEFENVLVFLNDYIERIGIIELMGKTVYVGFFHDDSFPPKTSLTFEINGPSEDLHRVGYFNVNRYIKNNIH